VIVAMSKVQVLGPRRLLPEAIRLLHAQGVLQLRSLPDALEERPGKGGRGLVTTVPLAEAELATERSLEEVSRRVEGLLLLLPAARGGGGEAGGLPDVTSPECLPRLTALESEVHALTDRRLALAEERDLTARYERLLTALAPLRPGLLGATHHVETVGLVVRRDRPEALALLEREVDRITRGAYSMLSREIDREQVGVLLTVPQPFARDLSRLLFERGIGEIRLPERYAGRPLVDALALLLRRSQELPVEIREVEAALVALAARWRGPLTQALRAARDRLARLRAMTRCGETGHAFVISGWVPAERCRGLASALGEAFGGRVTLVEHAIPPEEYGEVPVTLRNRRFVRSFELLLSLVPLPRYGSIDPTPFLAGFFPLFFGLMLGDVGFGGLALVLALVARAKGWGGESGRQLTTVALACSVSAIAFGLLFGELFGELGAHVGLRPLLLDRKEAILSFLALALALGAVHVVLGIGLALAAAIRRGRRHEALARSAALALILAAIAALLGRLGYLSPAPGRVALLALGPLLAIAIALEGLRAPLELVTTAGSILSYARLMALGIASVMLADVANRMAGFFRPAALGVAAAVLLHAVNFAMGLFSPTIQALRLHYVEFFDKFYEGGGKPYEPFALTA
jgi:V/A-type H+-transporting ATPase subunit I